MIDQNIVIFGAGKIGRSFIGQLFGKAGYEVVFVDMDHSLVEGLNRRRAYTVVIKGPDREDRLEIKNVRAIHALDEDLVVEAIRNAGQNHLANRVEEIDAHPRPLPVFRTHDFRS